MQLHPSFKRLGNWALRSLNGFPQVTEPESVTFKHQYRIQNYLPFIVNPAVFKVWNAEFCGSISESSGVAQRWGGTEHSASHPHPFCFHRQHNQWVLDNWISNETFFFLTKALYYSEFWFSKLFRKFLHYRVPTSFSLDNACLYISSLFPTIIYSCLNVYIIIKIYMFTYDMHHALIWLYYRIITSREINSTSMPLKVWPVNLLCLR